MARHGRPVAEFRPIHKIDFRAAAAAKVQPRARRDAGKMLPVTAVELLRQIYEDP